MDALGQDLRFAFRTLVKSPAFAVVAVLTLGLGIGANTAVFSVVDAALLRPLPYPEPEEVVQLGWRWSPNSYAHSLSAYKFEFWREHSRSFEGMATWRTGTVRLGGDDGADATVLRVTDDFFTVVGTGPARGRAFAADEHEPGGPNVAVLSARAWRERFGASPDVVGRQVRIDGAPHTILGVMPEDFRFVQGGEFDVVAPLRLQADPRDQGHNSPVIARLREGVSREAVAADMRRVHIAFGSEFGPGAADEPAEGVGIEVLSYQDVYASGLRAPLLILLGAVGFVLLIACANVANLLLARATGRQRELVVRAALGAGRGRLIRQLVTESLVLAALAAAFGLLIGLWSVDAMLAAMPAGLPRADEIGLDPRVLGFALALTLVTGLLFGLAAAVPATRADLAGSLREGDRGSDAASGRKRARGLLIVGEAALSTVLLIGAGLLIVSLARLYGTDAGFQPRNLLTLTYPRLTDRYASPADLARFERQALERIRAVPGVAAAASMSNLPLERGYNIPLTTEAAEGRDTEAVVEWRAVSPDYFRTLGIPVLRGREFDDRDGTEAPRVVVVNRTFAEQHFGGTSALGATMRIGFFQGGWLIPDVEGPPQTIVGVVADVKEIGLDRPVRPTVYVPTAQTPAGMFGPGGLTAPDLAVRTTEPERVLPEVRRILAEAGPGLPDPAVRPMEAVIGESLAQQRFQAVLFGAFAALALVLTGIGIYGVVAYSVGQRTREIGIRMALGARAGDVVAMVLRQGTRLVAAGVGVGLLAAWGLSRFLASLLYGVEPTDPATFAAVALLVLALAALASYVPARRATRIDPMTALNRE